MLFHKIRLYKQRLRAFKTQFKLAFKITGNVSEIVSSVKRNDIAVFALQSAFFINHFKRRSALRTNSRGYYLIFLNNAFLSKDFFTVFR